MKSAGKKIAFLGDSITEGHGVANSENVYWRRVERLTGASVWADGIGGTRFAVQKKPSPDPRHDMDFLSRIGGIPADADIVVVFGGTNDFGHGDAPFGQFTDRTPDTFYGATHTLCRALLERFSDREIVLMTPLHRANEDNPCGDGKPAPVAPLSSYVAAIKEVAAYYAIPVLDLYTLSGMNPKVDFIAERYMPDGLHPNDAGQEKIARRLVAFLESL